MKYGHAAHFTLNFYYCLFIMLLFDFIEAVIKYEKFVFFRRGATRKISFEEGGTSPEGLGIQKIYSKE